MVNSIKLKLPGLDERDVLLTNRQYGNTTAASSTAPITINSTSTNINTTTTLTTITTMPKGMTVKLSRTF